MNLEVIDQINQQMAVWKTGLPLSTEAHQRLQSKQDLLWSYHSNHLEGNTLTYGETELLLIHGEVSGTHSARDIDEMRAHQVAVQMIRQWAQDNREITEADIRDINKVLLKEPFTKETITPQGLPASRLITPGVYKNEPNHVRTQSGELFRFAEPFEVPAKMEAFTENLRKPLPNEAFDIAARLASLHHEFILIHPFDDGNGRTIRLLLNYVLLRGGLPAIVIKSDDKEKYLTALRLADAGEHEALVAFLLDCFKYALELGVKAIKGESLDEPDDADMKLAILKRRLLTGGTQEVASAEQQWSFCRNYILPYFKQFMLKFAQKNELFASNEQYMHLIFEDGGVKRVSNEEDFIAHIESNSREQTLLKRVTIGDQSRGFLGKSEKSFDTTTVTRFEFGANTVVMDERQIPYDAVLTENEAKALVAQKLEELIQTIERKAK